MSRQCPPGTSRYVVKTGDTFFKLAKEFATSVSALVSANPATDPNALQIGQTICIPRQPVYPACPEGNYYTIRSGDTLNTIARSYRISLADLLEANPGINPERLAVGQIICIPLATPPVTCPPGTRSYIIQTGDTFYTLAGRFNTTVEALTAANPGINPNALLIGQRICVPEGQPSETCPGEAVPYIIQAGDTLFRIAQRYNTTVESLFELNPGINPNGLRVGQRICIPRPRAAYSNLEYHVSFLYPADWEKVNDERFEGADGFFQISAIQGDSLSEVCRNEAFHVLNPYGSDPQIDSVTVQNQPGCLILPSADQPPEMRSQAALILEYPRPIEIRGQTYRYFVLWADQVHIRELADTVNFVAL